MEHENKMVVRGGSAKRGEIPPEHFIPSWGLRQYTRIEWKSWRKRSRDSWGKVAREHVERIKKQEADLAESEQDATGLRNNRKDLAFRYKRSLAEPSSLSHTAGWLDGLKMDRPEESSVVILQGAMD
ncbi:hypothetical protein Tco_0860495 [Tanacetum coccineum]|uniref:Uncharacterized protein n=1 Tax=Tanacetum coccineum TaxID=301880 RepID=A0ABQ5BI24_9ASTR